MFRGMDICMEKRVEAGLCRGSSGTLRSGAWEPGSMIRGPPGAQAAQLLQAMLLSSRMEAASGRAVPLEAAVCGEAGPEGPTAGAYALTTPSGLGKELPHSPQVALTSSSPLVLHCAHYSGRYAVHVFT